jgi:hypothetical protein
LRNRDGCDAHRTEILSSMRAVAPRNDPAIEAALQALRLEHLRLRSASDIAEAKSLTSHLRARGPAVVPHKL